MSENKWQADVDKYKEMAEPFESVDKAQQVSKAFISALRKLRENYRIAELTVSFIVYAKDGETETAISGGAGWGNQLMQVQLAKNSFDQEFKHVMKLLSDVLTPQDVKDFITDPKGEQAEAEDATA